MANHLYLIRLHLERDEESGVYTVTSPDVPELVTEGATPEEIQHNVQEVIDGLLEVWADLGVEPPPALDRARSIASTDAVQKELVDMSELARLIGENWSSPKSAVELLEEMREGRDGDY